MSKSTISAVKTNRSESGIIAWNYLLSDYVRLLIWPSEETKEKKKKEKNKMKEVTWYHLFVFLYFFPKLVIVPHFLVDDK